MRLNNINELGKDSFALILMWLSPREWAIASQVCRLWNERAHLINVRQQISRNFFIWFVEKSRENFKAIENFIDVEELIDFLIRQDIPTACKIFEFNNLKASFFEKGKTNFYFQKTLSKQFLRDERGRCLIPLNEFIDRLNLFLVHPLRLSMDRRLTNLIPQFNEILSQFYQEGSVKNFHENLPKELIALLETDNYQKSMVRLSHIGNLARSVRPRYLRRYGIVNTLGSNSRVICYLILLACGLLSLGAGIGLIVSSLDSNGVMITDFRLFLGGLALTMVGGPVTIGVVVPMTSTGFCDFCSSRNRAALSLDNNANTDTIIEIPLEPTEGAPLLPDNAVVREEILISTDSDVEMQADDGESRFSMH